MAKRNVDNITFKQQLKEYCSWIWLWIWVVFTTFMGVAVFGCLMFCGFVLLNNLLH